MHPAEHSVNGQRHARVKYLARRGVDDDVCVRMGRSHSLIDFADLQIEVITTDDPSFFKEGETSFEVVQNRFVLVVAVNVNQVELLASQARQRASGGRVNVTDRNARRTTPNVVRKQRKGEPRTNEAVHLSGG